MAKKSKVKSEFVLNFILTISGFIIIIISLRYGIGNLKQPGLGLFTFFVGLLILISSLILAIRTLKSSNIKVLFENRHELKTFLLMNATLILWIVAMPYLGYVTVTLVSTYCFCKIGKLEGWIKPLALSIGTALFIYLLFDYWLYIDLPRGILEF